MQIRFLPWDNRPIILHQPRLRLLRLHHRLLHKIQHLQIPGPALVEQSTPANSVPTAVVQNLPLPRAGLVLVVLLIKESFVRNVERRNLLMPHYIAAINVDGNRKTQRIRLNSVRNAEISLTKTTFHKPAIREVILYG